MASFGYKVNGGLDALQVRLPRKLGEIGEQGEPASDLDMVIGNEVELMIMDAEAADGAVIFHGRIEGFTTITGAGDEGLEVLITPDSSLFADLELDGEKAFEDTDPAEMLKWFLDEGYLPGWVWDTSNPTDTGQTASHIFSNERFSAIFETIRQLAGPMWYWLGQVDHKVKFAEYPSTGDHVFRLGLDVARLAFSKDASRRKTRVIVHGADGISAETLSPEYDEDHPLVLRLGDTRIVEAATAQSIANTLLDTFDKVDLRTSVQVIDSSGWGAGGRDIEAIKPGQTCRVLNPANLGALPTWEDAIWGTSHWDGLPSEMTKEVLSIMRVRYTPDAVTLDLASPQPDFVGQYTALSDAFRRLVTA